MAYIGLDCSFNSLGYCIISTEQKIIELGTVTPKKYRYAKYNRKYEHWNENSNAIVDYLITKIIKYRNELNMAMIEEIAIGFHKANTNSTYNLVYEVAVIATALRRIFGINVTWVAPSHHKKLLTGNGKASKEQSVEHMLRLFPSLQVYHYEKLDDVADALALCLTAIPYQDFKDFQLHVNI